MSEHDAHTSVLYRAYRGKTLLALRDSEPDGADTLVKELSLLDALVKVHLKNYQVWSVYI